MPIFDIPLTRRDAHPTEGREPEQVVVAVEANSLQAAIRRVEAQYPRWAAKPEAATGSGPIPDGDRRSKILRIWV